MAKVDLAKLRKVGEVFDSPELIAAADELALARALIEAYEGSLNANSYKEAKAHQEDVLEALAAYRAHVGGKNNG